MVTVHSAPHALLPFRGPGNTMSPDVRSTILSAAITDLNAETGDETLLEPLQKIWKDVVQRKLYITGASGALYDGASPDGTEYDPGHVHQVHQAWGRPYQLPNITAHNETCANVGNVLWAWRMFQLEPEAEFIDMAELALYNSVLSGTSLDGERFLYTNPLRVDDRYPDDLRWGNERIDYIEISNCCSPNVVRTFTQVQNYVYSLSEQGLWVNLYGANELATELEDGTEVQLTQHTDYPWDGTVEIELQEVPDREFSLFMRIPGWVRETELTINGEQAGVERNAGQYAELRRQWSSGDRVVLELPMQARLIESHPLVEETRNQVAVKRGPLVYSLESVDFPEDGSIFEVTLPSDIKFTPEEIEIEGRQIMSLTGTAHLTEHGDWAATLYLEASSLSHPFPVRLIPYYAWGNRGDSEMTVWMPYSV
jgi:DUF1680 family protein